jgi:hypothetical protein
MAEVLGALIATITAEFLCGGRWEGRREREKEKIICNMRES